MKKQKEIQFKFEEVPLDEAISASMAGDGNYSGVKAMLLTELPKLERANAVLAPQNKKTLAFGSPNGKELEERNRRGICMAINIVLNHAGLSWRLTYIGTRKLFVCIPRQAKRIHKNPPIVLPKLPPTARPQPLAILEFRNKVIELSLKGRRPFEIAQALNSKMGRVNAVYYKYVKGKKSS